MDRVRECGSAVRLRGAARPVAAAAPRRGVAGGMKKFHPPGTLGETGVVGESDGISHCGIDGRKGRAD